MTPLLGMEKPIIGMVHLPALPGSPFAGPISRQELLAAARRDRDILLEVGFDAISISNEGDRPYVSDVPKETVALITWLVSELTRDIAVPFGCGVLIDPRASLAVAQAVGAAFVRLSYGVTAGPFGLLVEHPGEILRYKRTIGADDIAVLANLSPHFSTSLDQRPVAEIARTYWALTEAEAIQVHGAGAGVPPQLSDVVTVKEALPLVPVIVASGITAATVADALAVADGVIVGTSLKYEGQILNPIDPERARAFVNAAREARLAPL